MPRTYEGYTRMREKFNPLDLIFFKEGEGSSFDHVGLVVNRDIIPSISQLKPGKFYIWESTRSVPDIDKEDHLGLQIRDLEQVLSQEQGEVAWAPLFHNPWLIEDHTFIIEKTNAILTRYGRRGYTDSFWSNIFPCLRKPLSPLEELSHNRHWLLTSLPSTQHHDRYFCSELVAIVYQELNLIAPQYDPRDILPIDLLGYDLDGLPKFVSTPTFLQPDLQSSLPRRGSWWEIISLN